MANVHRSIAELWERINDDSNKVPVETCENLINSMPNQINAASNARGGPAKF